MGGSKALYQEFELSQLTAATVRFLLLWGVPVAIGTLALSLYLDHRIGRGHRWGWPRLWPARVGKVLLTLINVASVSWLVFALFVSSGRNLANGAQRINGLIGQQTPDLAFHRVDSDKELRLHQFKGRVVLLNLWATWCAPCVQELPELAKLQQIYGERGLIVITLSQEERNELLEFASTRPSPVINGYAKD
ncbi:MAG TPA: redoxin domain-containing protein, partial [Thermoanaerobaculia bacterium]